MLSNEESSQESPLASTSQSPTLSRNVKLTLWYTGFVFCGRSIWNQNVLATLIFLLRDGDPKAVGYVTAVMGICQLIASAPTGILADSHRRDTLLKVASGVGLLAVGTTAFSVVLVSKPSYNGLLLAMCSWGCYFGIANTSLSAIFADSIPNGQRSKYFTKRSILINIGNVAGPTITLIMFLVLGNEWTVRECAIVMGVAQLVCLPALGLLWFFNDDDICEDDDAGALNHIEDDSSNSQSLSPENQSEAQPSHETDNGLSEPLLSPEESILSDSTQHEDETYNAAKLASMLPFCCNEKRIIPIMVATADVMAGLASGMSIRFIAIFLYDNLDMKPVYVQSVFIFTPLVRAALMKIGQSLAKTYGRCCVTVVFKWIGIVLMLIMVVMAARTKLVLPISIVLVLRGAFMNATSALTKSVLMDHVPKQERAKWSALESFNMFSWSGSAALGGILVDYDGILFNFCITAGLQFLATIPHLLLAFSVDWRRSTVDIILVPNQQEQPLSSEVQT